MICYDCATDDRTTPAQAVCGHCGAAVCRDHVRVRPRLLTAFAGTGTAPPLPARRATCLVCRAADREAAG